MVVVAPTVLLCPYCDAPARLGDANIYHALGDRVNIAACPRRPKDEAAPKDDNDSREEGSGKE